MAGIAAAGFLFSTRILISYGVHFTRLCREGVGRWVPACGARPPRHRRKPVSIPPTVSHPAPTPTVIPVQAGIHPFNVVPPPLLPSLAPPVSPSFGCLTPASIPQREPPPRSPSLAPPTLSVIPARDTGIHPPNAAPVAEQIFIERAQWLHGRR